jgi:hypothetical protein
MEWCSVILVVRGVRCEVRFGASLCGSEVEQQY